MKNQNMSAYDRFTTNKIRYSDYQNSDSEYKPFSGKLKESCGIPWEAIHINNRQHQTRDRDTDVGHVAALASDIEAVGLKSLPYVEWDAATEKFVPLSGHHRLFAMHRNNLKNGLTEELYPVAIVEFSDLLAKEEFLQSQNNHRPSKPHGKDDAVIYLQRLKKRNVFAGATDKEDIKKIAYPLLTKNYPRLHTKSKSEVLDKVFRFETAKVKVWQPSEVKDEMSRIYGDTYSSGHVSGDVCYIRSIDNAVGKAIYNAVRDRAISLKNKNTKTPLSIKIVTWFNGKAEKISASRTKHLEEMSMFNEMIINSNVACIEEVNYLHQVIGSESTPCKYVWCSSKKKFV